MKPSVRRIVFSRIFRAGWPVGLLLLIPLQSVAQHAEPGVSCLREVSKADRLALTQRLQKITGWLDLQFDSRGVLRKGQQEPVGGSSHARNLLEQAISGAVPIVVEDASGDPTIVFSQVRYAQLKYPATTAYLFVIQIDFTDFRYVRGDRMALQAFDLGWVVLHELDHIVNDSLDASYSWQAGDCEEQINLMREECGLPVRQDYFFTFLPALKDSVFAQRFVRLAFEKETDGTKRKYWLIWDAHLVGTPHTQIASRK